MAVASPRDIGLNIKRARTAAKLTQDAAATAAGLSRAAYRSLEAGESEPRARTILALSDALSVRPDELLRPAPPLPRARFRSSKRLNDREILLLKVARQLEDYADLEELLDERRQPRLDLTPDGTRPGRPVARASLAREALGLGAKENVRDIAGLLEDRAGVKVLRLDVATDAFFGLSIASGPGAPAIVVNTWDRISVERWIFTAAHELGHLLLHDGDFDADGVQEIVESEREANLFAGEFLMPAVAFDSEWDESAGLDFYERVLKVKHIFQVSYKTVLYRLQERGVPNVWVRFQIEARRHLGKTLTKTDEPSPLDRDAFGWGNPEPSKAREPGALSGIDFTPDRRARLVRQAIDTGAITVARGAEILGLPLARMKTLQASWI